MFVYALHYDSSLNILLYPKTIHDTLPERSFHQYRQYQCQVAFVNLFDDFGDATDLTEL